jgi:hypothetical protein
VSEDQLLQAILNLARFHREHEKFYSAAPLESAAALQRASRTLKALADRWIRIEPGGGSAASPFAGAEDLNDERAIEAGGVLFMEGEGEPAEIGSLKRDLATAAENSEGTGLWLGRAMEQSWAAAERLTAYPELADVLGERHRIIANDWQNAGVARLIARLLERAVVLLEAVDFAPAALRKDLAGDRRAPAYLYSSSELLDRAADLSAESAVLVHENERRWRVFRAHVDEVVRARQGRAGAT